MKFILDYHRVISVIIDWFEQHDGYGLESLTERISKSIREGGEEASTLKPHRRCGLETDLAVHVCRHGAAGGEGPSDLALRLASELRAYGLVEHTLWEERR